MTALLSIVNKLLIFAKSPIKGKVKTRLKKDTPLTDEDILKLYTAFLKDTIISASLSKAQRIYVAYYPEDSRDVMYDIVFQSSIFNLQSSIELFPQSGNDFDDRLTNALRNIHNKNNDNIIILGSDSPHIQPSTINKAFSFLKSPLTSILSPLGRGGSGRQSPLPLRERVRVRGAMVLGPSGEGGVYLIGLRYPSPTPSPAGGEGKREGGYFNFKGVFTAGNESDNLLKIGKSKKLPLLLLEELTDVDVKSDLITLISNLSIMQYSAGYTKIHLPRYTINAIKSLGLTIGRKGSGTREKYLSYSTS
ncbi:MAG: hypothetical protein A2889_08980 [Nitrospinae bacterium RIFCSPLOWO2_01_FULL_39_10]|nr:MAG: hypothetical protein A2889_08980 [Nitrospinae bacterium RIFCSPLOWO2_01_FULL_39_10]